MIMEDPANSREAAAKRSPGLAAFFAANPGDDVPSESTLKGLSEYATLSGLASCTVPPRVDRKKRGQPWALIRSPFRASAEQTPGFHMKLSQGFCRADARFAIRKIMQSAT
ncbi:MAG: hypothetical protein JXA73_00690 [Acidobacteria bacterium]|nr:hypothetical protein [Acidobacteriota bacterium]